MAAQHGGRCLFHLGDVAWEEEDELAGGALLLWTLQLNGWRLLFRGSLLDGCAPHLVSSGLTVSFCFQIHSTIRMSLKDKAELITGFLKLRNWSKSTVHDVVWS